MHNTVTFRKGPAPAVLPRQRYMWVFFFFLQDFGSIFSTLLPGTQAKLAPPEGQTVLDGLEVKVAFGDVWKESLNELSGGQR